AGGIHDHLSGGFARYSTDATWLVPHFEKMLYDNALLAEVYIDAARLLNNPTYRLVAERTLKFMMQEMRIKGGLIAAIDADSQGVEGRYYVWSKRELEQI